MKGKRKLMARSLASMMSASMVLSLCPVSALAAPDTVYTDGTYTGTATVEPNERHQFDAYDIAVDVTVTGGKVAGVAFSDTNEFGTERQNKLYSGDAMSGWGSYTGIANQIIANNGTDNIDVVSEATCSSKAIVAAVANALQNAEAAEPTPTPTPTPEVVDTAALSQAISDAKAKIQSDYTEDSWKKLAEALEAAEAVLGEETPTQEGVDEAAAALNEAISALVAAPEEDDDDDNNEEIEYVLMNIPYAKFYAEEVSNGVSVDTVSSATLAKTKTGSLVGGSYHKDSSGSSIDGIIFPVKVGEGVDLSQYKKVTDSDSVEITVTNRGQTSTTVYSGKEALFENPDYAYYVLGEAPSYYKELTVGADGSLSFGAVQGAAVTSGTVSVDFTTDTTYGDYELDITGGLNTSAFKTIYGVVIGTTDGTGYGLRHLENIWRNTYLAWSAGYTTTVHGCQVSYAHYASMMGKTINTVTYYTDGGIFKLNLNTPVKVPAKFSGYTLEVEDAVVTSGKTEVTLAGIPDDFDPVYSVKGLEDVKVSGNELTYNAETASKGEYTLTVSDKNGVYADITATFELRTDRIPAEYNEDEEKLVKADDATDEEFAEFISKISAVTVDGKSYAASGRGATVIVDKDGTINSDAQSNNKKVFEDGHTYGVVVKATGYPELSFEYEMKVVYLLMNIPYADFYAAEVAGSDTGVDAVSSATLNKTRTGSLVGGSYHVDSKGTDITGITFPVKVSADADLSAYKQITDGDEVTITVTNRGQTNKTTYTGSAALFENESYAYYVLSAEEAAQLTSYKELTVAQDGTLSFGAVQGAVTQLEASADFTTDTSYGDYELDILKSSFDTSAFSTIYGVVIGTTDGSSYGLRHLENIWQNTQLAWSAGFTKVVHGCTLGYEHYVSMMGKTINTVTYYTNTGIYELSLAEPAYVPVKFEGELSVADAMVSDGQTTVTLPTGMPEDYNAEYSVKGLDITVADGVLTFPKDAAFGTYTLKVTDKDGVYADLNADFILVTEAMPAEYNGSMDAPALVKADGYTDEEFAAYIGAISAVSVNGTKYAASGRGATILINADGTLAADAKPIAEAGAYEMTVSAAGYQDLSFTYKAFNMELLSKTIEQAKALNESNYTADSWADVKTKLAAAEAELADPDTQETVDAAAIDLLQAIAGLVVADKPDSEIDTSALAAAVAAAKTLKESDYTEASWKTFAAALANAEAVLAAPESQTAVDNAKTVLADAVGALVKKTSDNSGDDSNQNPAPSAQPTVTPAGTSGSSSGNGTSTGTKTSAGTGNTGTVSKSSSTKTGDMTNIIGWLAAAAAAMGAGGVSLKMRGRKRK